MVPNLPLVLISESSQLAKAQAPDSPVPDESFRRSPSLSNMLSEMATHSRRIQDRNSEPPRRRTTTRNIGCEPLVLPSHESIIYSLYAIPPSSPDYSVIAHDHRFPRNAVGPQQRSPSRCHPPPPMYSETDPNASSSVTLSEMGLCVRGGISPQLPPPYS